MLKNTGHFLGSFILCLQHLLDAVCGHSAPAASKRLQALMHWINVQVDFCIGPWFCGAPLTALLKLGGGYRPIAVGETLCHLVSKVCCLTVRGALPGFFLPFDQVRMGVPEAAVHSLCTTTLTVGSHSHLCCLKLDMTLSNALNECSLFVSQFFLSSYLCSYQWNGVTVLQGSYILVHAIFRPPLGFNKVTLWVPFFLL